MTKNDIIDGIVFGFVAVVILVGVCAGYAFGDYVLENSTNIRAKDFLLCRIGLPIVGGIVFLFVAVIVGDEVQRQLKSISIMMNNEINPTYKVGDRLSTLSCIDTLLKNEIVCRFVVKEI